MVISPKDVLDAGLNIVISPKDVLDAGLNICSGADQRPDHEDALAGEVRLTDGPGVELKVEKDVEGQIVAAAEEDLRQGGAHLVEVASLTRQLAHQRLQIGQQLKIIIITIQNY